MVRTAPDKQNSRTFQRLFKDKSWFSKTKISISKHSLIPLLIDLLAKTLNGVILIRSLFAPLAMADHIIIHVYIYMYFPKQAFV